MKHWYNHILVSGSPPVPEVVCWCMKDVCLKVAGHVDVPEEDGVGLLHGYYFARPNICSTESRERGVADLIYFVCLHFDRYRYYLVPVRFLNKNLRSMVKNHILKAERNIYKQHF